MENRTAEAVVKNLNTLSITQLAEWDVLAFIHNHGTSLASAEQIASLVGYSKAIVGSTLESLTGKGLVQRSRNSRGVRVYRFIATGFDDPPQRALEELLKVAEQRQGRLLLIKHLGQARPDKQLRDRGGLHLA